MGRKSRTKKEGQLKGMYKMLRKEGKVESYTFGENKSTGKMKTMALNPLKHILLLKKYKDPDAQQLMKNTYEQYKAFITQYKERIAASANTNNNVDTSASTSANTLVNVEVAKEAAGDK